MNKFITKNWKNNYEELNNLDYENFYNHPTIIKTMIIYNKRNYFELSTKYLKEINYIANRIEESKLLKPIANKDLNDKKISIPTGKWICRSAEIKNIFKTKIQNITEIGVGYGGLCRILMQIYPKLEYTLIDFPTMLNLAKYFLKDLDNYDNLNFIDTIKTEEIKFDDIDLLISNNALDEATDEYREIVYTKIFPHVKNFLFVINARTNVGKVREKLLEELNKYDVEVKEYNRYSSEYGKDVDINKINFDKIIATRK